MGKALNDLELTILNTIRRHPNLIKSEIAGMHDYPWSSVSTAINSLADEKTKMLVIKENDLAPSQTQKALYRATVSVNPDYEHYVGISVGSSNLKIVFVGFDFAILNEEHIFCTSNTAEKFYAVLKKHNFKNQNNEKCQWCAPTPNDSTQLCNVLIDICNAIYDLKAASVLSVAAITFTFPGHIDFEKQKIISTANLCNNDINQANITRLITSSVFKKLEDNDINIYIDHNVKSCTISEQEILFTSNSINKKTSPKNLITIYLGKGIGIGMILNNRLYRGNDNLAGQLGHITFPPNNKELEAIIREDIFSSTEKGIAFENLSSEELKHFISKDENKEKKERFINLMATTLINLVQILGIEDIIFSGKFDSLFDVIEIDLISKLQSLSSLGFCLHHSHYGEYSAAVGAAISCFNNLYDLPYEWK